MLISNYTRVLYYLVLTLENESFSLRLCVSNSCFNILAFWSPAFLPSKVLLIPLLGGDKSPSGSCFILGGEISLSSSVLIFLGGDMSLSTSVLIDFLGGELSLSCLLLECLKINFYWGKRKIEHGIFCKRRICYTSGAPLTSLCIQKRNILNFGLKDPHFEK